MEVSGRYLASATTWPFLPPPISPDHLDGARGGGGEKESVGRWLNMRRLVRFLHLSYSTELLTCLPQLFSS